MKTRQRSTSDFRFSLPLLRQRLFPAWLVCCGLLLCGSGCQSLAWFQPKVPPAPVMFETTPPTHDLLVRVAVPFREFDENTETFAVEPIVRCASDGTITGLRFSNQLMQAIDPNSPDVQNFYLAYRELCARITNPNSQVSFRLNGGEILVVAAHRVLHGRQAFEPVGRRHLQDAYFEFDNVKNHLVVLRRKGKSRQ